MIAVVRVRWNNTPPGNVWTDAVTNEWMNPNTPFSLAHYWTRTSLFQADMRFYLFPPIAIDDPRAKTPAGGDSRQYLVDGVLAEVTRLFSPDWKLFERAILVFAQQTDLFGGGSHIVPVGDGTKSIPAAVCDLASSFDQVVQEVGHAFGLDHEVDGLGREYQSPYSSMSSETYGYTDPSFKRPVDSRLPIGVGVDNPPSDGQRTIGPYITPVQFYLSKSMPSFNDPGTVYQVPASYIASAHSFRLTAVDAAIDSWPVRKPMLAVLPPAFTGGHTYFVELRRSSSYDAGFTLDGANGAPMALAVHAVNPSTGRVRYVDRIPLNASSGDRHYYSPEGAFGVRLDNFESDFSSCGVTVGGGGFWRYFGVELDSVLTNRVPDHDGEWTTADVSPCFMFPKSLHQYRYRFSTTEISCSATALGYAKPNYTWFINDQLLDPAQSQLQFRAAVRGVSQGVLTDPAEQDVVIQYAASQNTLRFTCKQPYADFYVVVKAMVSESSEDVIANLYPERSVWTGVSFDNVSVQWDQAYYDAQNTCARRIKDVNDHYSISQSPVQTGGPGPGPEFGVDTVTLVNALVASNPAVANAVINEIARLGNVGKLDVLKRLM
jgi:hypothetical protein